MYAAITLLFIQMYSRKFTVHVCARVFLWGSGMTFIMLIQKLKKKHNTHTHNSNNNNGPFIVYDAIK